MRGDGLQPGSVDDSGREKREKREKRERGRFSGDVGENRDRGTKHAGWKKKKMRSDLVSGKEFPDVDLVSFWLPLLLVEALFSR